MTKTRTVWKIATNNRIRLRGAYDKTTDMSCENAATEYMPAANTPVTTMSIAMPVIRSSSSRKMIKVSATIREWSGESGQHPRKCAKASRYAASMMLCQISVNGTRHHNAAPDKRDVARIEHRIKYYDWTKPRCGSAA